VSKAGEIADLIVIGGGIHGCSAALHAAMRGLSVIVVERETVGRHASGVNAGNVRRCGRDLAELPISVHSMALWKRIADLVDDDCGFQQAPIVVMAENEADQEVARQRVADVRLHGYEHEVLLDEADLRGIVPAASGRCIGGFATLDDGHAQPYQTVLAFRRKAQSLGVSFREGAEVADVRRRAGDWQVASRDGMFTGRYLLNCAGAWGGEFARQLGEPVPIESIAPMMMVTNRLPRFCDAIVSLVSRPMSFKQTTSGTVVIGGGRRGQLVPGTHSSEILFQELQLAAETVISVFPAMSSARIVRTWGGIEGYLPDRLPVIGRSSTEENAFHAFGFSTHGFQLGPGVGDIMAELIATGATNTPVSAFAIERFASDASGEALRKNVGGRTW
jgi:sarcosine oxidase, subunit beta